MNFLMPRSNSQTAAQEQQSVKETQVEPNYASNNAATLEGLISGDSLTKSTSSETRNEESDEYGDENGNGAGSSGKCNSQVDGHIDVAGADGLIIIPNKEVPENWTEAPDILSLRSLDRSFVFPGEQFQVFACLSAYKQDTEIIMPFKVAASMNKNGIGQSPPKLNGNSGGETNTVSEAVVAGIVGQDNQNGEITMKGEIDSQNDVSTGESLLRMEDQKRQTEQLLQRFKNSHFFGRITESNEPLWSKRRVQEACFKSSETFEEKLTGDSRETATTVRTKNPISAMIDKGKFDARTSGGVARGAANCCSLSNGDLVVLSQVNVGVEFVKDPVLEILQFEKYRERNLIVDSQDILTSSNHDPYAELLKWLLPLDNSTRPPVRPVIPPTSSSSSSIRSTSTKHTKHAVSGTSGSQLFSFGHIRSYSMSSLPPNMTSPQSVTTPIAKTNFDPDDWNQFSFKKFADGKNGKERLLSFRGVPLEPGRFSVQCGLEGIFTPGRRWRRRIELIQPVEIRSFSVDCTTDDLLCVHVKNVSPAHAPDIVVFIDAITIVFEEASKGGPPLFLSIACVEAGNDHALPNLALRRGEEHSFILKPATTLWKRPKGQNDIKLRPPHLSAGSAASSWHHSNNEGKSSEPPADQYAVLVSCRCNYTESKLFFKQSISWRPRISRDLTISVASEMLSQTSACDGTQLPVQVLTLQASNLTSDNLTLTVLAPASFTSPPSVVSLSNSPASPLNPFADSAELGERVNSDRQGTVAHELSPVEDNMVPNSDLGCTHLWLQSRVPLGCVPAQSTATIKLEVLPLTDGIIALDSLQIDVKEKGLTYIPEHSLKINATSSVATGVH
ncbi:hypothetical protein BUALT_Bualt05G0151500 [Buddleja alternifolia]|uniref:Uncharacterized protein n=1 Tax=Buddleja alternifolia TaxID=168488 RepID=A0AAV6XKV8_9LAMI|nr:hypothetical protein BUALT_Bualt05G0151500 [Buddleja alternifolia]